MNKENQKYKMLDLFCGCGGLSLGIKKSSERFEIIGGIDVDDKSISCYKYNFPEVNKNTIVCADIENIKPEDYMKILSSEKLGSPDIITGGPPCPGFSTIGRSKIMSLVKKGVWSHLSETRHKFIDDPRNKLFFKFVEYVNFFKPSLFLMENVSGMRSYKSKNGESILKVIEKEFSSIGYNVKYKLINSADYGVPQIRLRYFFIGTRKNLNSCDFSFPEATHEERKINYFHKRENRKEHNKRYFENVVISHTRIKNHKLPYISSMQALIDLPIYTNDKKEKDINYRFSIEKSVIFFKKKYRHDILGQLDNYIEMMNFLKWVRLKNMNDKSFKNDSITCHEPRMVNERDKKIFPKLRTERDKVVKYGDLPDEFKVYGNKGFQDKMRRIPWWRPSWTIVAHLQKDGYMFIHPDTEQNRSITVREAARLQSFPDYFDFSAGGKIARTHQYRLVGNAVPPLVAKAFGTAILNWLDKIK